jgi:Na+-translocating ferredoxin:NAD+ oxidoreductase subunit G
MLDKKTLTENQIGQSQALTRLKASYKNALILSLFAFVSTGLIVITHSLTKDKIADEIEAALTRQLNQLIPARYYDNEVYKDCIIVSAEEMLGQSRSKIFRMRKLINPSFNPNINDSFELAPSTKQLQPHAVLLTAEAHDGYAGKITLAIAIYHDGRLAGVRVTEHQETPGLGDKIEIAKSDWIKQFDGLSLQNLQTDLWAVDKEGGKFDALTGATITPRAVINTVYKALVFHEENQEELYQSSKQSTLALSACDQS